MDRLRRSFLVEGVLCLLIIVDIVLFWRWNALATVAGLGLTAYAFLFFHEKEDIVFYLIGALIGAVTEIMCVHYGIWAYANPSFLGIPAWLPLIWGTTVLFARRLRDTVFRLGHERIHYEHHPSVVSFERTLVADLLLWSLLVLIATHSWRENGFMLAVSALFLVMNLLVYHRKEDLFFAVIFGVIASVMEMLFVGIGGWRYGNADLFGIPSWLPFAYALFAVLVGRTSKTVAGYLFRRKRKAKI